MDQRSAGEAGDGSDSVQDDQEVQDLARGSDARRESQPGRREARAAAGEPKKDARKEAGQGKKTIMERIKEKKQAADQ